MGRRLRAVVRWVLDWHTGVAVAASVLVALLAVAVVVTAQSNRDALAVARAKEAEISVLNKRITVLEDQVRDGNAHITELLTEVAALQEQVRQLGGQPVVVNVSTPSSSTKPSSSTPSTTTTTVVTTTTSTTVPCRLTAAGRCVTVP
jgi:cell division protein FtsB